MDESYGRDIAEIQDIRTKGSIFLIFEFLKRGIITKRKCRGIVDDMIDEGWYCSTDLYKNILKKMEEF